MRSKYKIVFLGNANVGKTTLITQFVYRQADKDYNPTIGIDFLCTKANISGKEVRLQLWDTAGQEKFNSIIPNYTRDSFISVIVYDLTNKDSFDNINHWIENLVHINDPEKKCKLIIVGNKRDKVEDHEEQLNIGKEKADLYGAKIVLTSAMVYEDFEGLESAIHEYIEDDIRNCENIVDLPNNTTHGKIADLKANTRRCC